MRSFKRIDRFAESFTFKYPQNASRQFTFKGALLTILSYACLIYFGYSFYRKYTDSKNVETSISQGVNKNTPRMDILESGFYPIFSFEGASGNGILAEEIPFYFTIIGLVLKLSLRNEDGSTTSTDLNNQVGYRYMFKPCSQIESVYKDKLIGDNDQAKDYINKYGLCPDIQQPELFYLEGNFYSPPRVQVYIEVYPCNIMLGPRCKPKEALLETSFAITLPKISLNPEDEKNPIKIAPDIGGFEFVDPDSKSKLDILVQKNEIWDDRSTLGDAELAAEFFLVESRAFSTKGVDRQAYTCFPRPDKCTPFFLVNLKGSDTVNKIKRTYVGILSTLGEVGGIFDLTLVVLGLLYTMTRLISCSERDLEASFMNRARLQSAIKGIQPVGSEHKQKGGYNSKRSRFKEGEVVDAVFADLLNGVDLVKTKMSFNVFSEAFLGEEEKCLLPLILALRELKKRLEIKEKAKTGNNRQTETKKASQITYQEAFSRILDKQPKNDVEKAIKEFFINEIPGGLFSGSGGIRPSRLESPWLFRRTDNPSTCFDQQKGEKGKVKKMNQIAPKLFFHSSHRSQDLLSVDEQLGESPRIERDLSIVSKNEPRLERANTPTKKDKKKKRVMLERHRF